MSVGMALRVVEDCEIVLRIRGLDRSFCGERIVLAKTDDKPIAPFSSIVPRFHQRLKNWISLAI